MESPGYEYLRSYQNMCNLYHKLLALNYQKEFCSLYKCAPIHKYYFSVPNDNSNDQQYLYTCLCAWLIKEKCHMNLELAPEDYEDIDVTINVILEALQLLLVNDENHPPNSTSKSPINFPPGRLKGGFGPEVIWSLNILADRALELMLEQQNHDSKVPKRPKLVYHNKNLAIDNNRQINSGNSNFITIGQPFVGGGLTTRPLGSYQIDDKSLLFDDDQDDEERLTEELIAGNHEQEAEGASMSLVVEPDEWYQQVQRAAQVLEVASMVRENNNNNNKSIEGLDENNWQMFLKSFSNSRSALQEFSSQFSPLLEAITRRIDKHMQVIKNRETFIQTNLASQLGKFLEVWRLYSKELANNNDLVERVTQRTDLFESHNEVLRGLGGQIEARIAELNDGSKLRELQSMTDRLKGENIDFDIKINLLLARYSEMEERILLEGEEESRKQSN